MSRGGVVGRRFVVAAAIIVFVGLVRWRHSTLPTPVPEPVWPTSPPSGPFRDVSPRWSHDGRRIAFLREWDTGHVQLCVAPADLSRVHHLTRAEVVNPDLPLATGLTGVSGRDEPAWSLDDRRIAFPRGAWFSVAGRSPLPGNGLWAVDCLNGSVLPVALHRSDYADRFCHYRSASWSSDGRRLAFVASGPLDRSRVGLATLDARSACFERADRFDASDWPAWSPRDGRLALVQGIARGPNAGRVATIRVIEPGGYTAGRFLTITPKRYRELCREDAARHAGTAIQPHIAGLRWTHDGKALVFALTPDARNLSRYSVWKLGLDQPERPVRVSPDDGCGYFAPAPLSDSALGVGRVRNGRMEAVVMTWRGDVIESRPAPRDDWDWRPDGAAVVFGGASGSARTTTLVVRSFDAGAATGRLR